MPTVTQQRTSSSSTQKAPPRKLSVLDRIAPVSLGQKKDATCIYGQSGTGKTTFACTYPKPLLIIGAEDGTRSVHNVDGVDYVRLKSSLEITDIINYQRSNKKWRTIFLDTATSLQAQILAEIKGMDELPTQLSWGFATRDEWGQSALQVKEWMRQLLKLAEENLNHTLIACQEKGSGGSTEGGDAEIFAPKVMGWLTGSAIGWLNPACDYVMQTYITAKTIQKPTAIKDPKTGRNRMQTVVTDDVEYRLRTRAHELYLIKFRVPKGKKAPPYIVDPDYEKVYNVLKGLQPDGRVPVAPNPAMKGAPATLRDGSPTK